MRAATRTRSGTGARRVRAGAALAALLLACAVGTAGTAGTAAADPAPGPSATATATVTAPAPTSAPVGQLPDSAPQSERLAAELRRNPVYVSADRPRELPRSLAPEIAALAARTGVPTYVLALPGGDEALLALVHDRLGANGVYVLIGDYGGITAAAFGVDAPVDDARRVALYGTPYRAGPLAAFEAFVDAIASGKERAAAESRELADRYRDREKPELYIDATDRHNQNLLLGLAVVVLPGLVLALGLRLTSRRGLLALPDRPPVRPRGKPVGKAGRTKAVRPRKNAPARPTRRRGVLPVTLLATAGTVLAVVLAAPAVFPQTVDGPDLTVTQDDLDARTRDAAAALTAGRIYQDPSVPAPLSAEQLTDVQQRIAGLAAKTPVYLMVTPTLGDDETAGDSRLLLRRVHRLVGHDGVYLQVDPLTGYLDLDAFGTGTDVESRFQHRSTTLRYPDRDSSDDLRIPSRLDSTLALVAEAGPDDGRDYGSDGTDLPPLRGNRLPALFSDDFAPGFTTGFLLLGILLLLAWGALAATRAAVHSRRARRDAPDRPQPTAPRRATALPTVRQLRGWADDDLRDLAAKLAAADQDAPGRARAWDCLDAAQLLAGAEPGRDRSRDRDRDRSGPAAPGDLAAAVVLARAGLDALDAPAGGPGPHLCRVNPLHGAATGGRVPFWFTTVGLGPRSARVCPACRDAFRAVGADRTGAQRALREREVTERLLHLPTADGRDRTVWSEAGDVLPAALEGLDPLILRARESASVQ